MTDIISYTINYDTLHYANDAGTDKFEPKLPILESFNRIFFLHVRWLRIKVAFGLYGTIEQLLS